MKTALLVLLAIFPISNCLSGGRVLAQTTEPTQPAADSNTALQRDEQTLTFEIAKSIAPKVVDTVKKITAAPMQPGSRKLPPSILAELRRSQRGQTFVYHDTLRANDIARAHLNDSIEKQYADSALAIVDTSVSLSHKEWLDSELVEIPELSRFGNKVHFEYPSSIMTETDLTPVPFDSTLLTGMNPVTRENLPYFDQSPIPMPLRPAKPMEAFVEAGAGNVYQPYATAWFERAVSNRMLVNGSVDYKSLSGTSLHSYFKIGATLDAMFGGDPADELYRSSDLKASFSYSGKSLAGVGDSLVKTTSFDHSISLLDGSVRYSGDATDQFHWGASLRDREWSDHAVSTLSESSQDIDAAFRYDPYIAHLRVMLEAGYAHASATISGTAPNFGVSPALSDEHINLLLGHRKGDGIEWYLGAALLAGNYGDNDYSEIRPLVRVRVPLNARWALGASSEPRVQLTTWRSLTETNPFYAKYGGKSADSSFGSTPRNVTMDNVNISAFMNYMLSPDDHIRVEGSFITRRRESVFSRIMSHDSSLHWFDADSRHDVQHIELSASGNFLLFTRDALTASVSLMKVNILDTSGELPFEPKMKASATYRFNSLSDYIFPLVEFHSISTWDRTINLLNVEGRFVLYPQLDLIVRAENILGSASDFWTGYEEYPTSVWASVRYRF